MGDEPDATIISVTMTDTNNKPDTTWEFEEVPCDFCGSTDAEVILQGPDRLHGLPGEFTVVTCRQCSLSRTSPRPTLESLGAAYPEQYDPYSKAPKHDPPKGMLRWALVNFRNYPLGEKSPAIIRALGAPLARRVLNKRRNLGYLPYIGQGKLLDFGCGAAGYVAKMAAAGWDAQGMDMSAHAVAAGREAGLTIHQGTLPGADLGEEQFDVVTMWQAIEHVPSPTATLAAIHKILKPGGLLLIVCPQLDSRAAKKFGICWFSFELPRHLTHFTRATLRARVEGSGFKIEKMLSTIRPSIVRKSWHISPTTAAWTLIDANRNRVSWSDCSARSRACQAVDRKCSASRPRPDRPLRNSNV